MTDAKTHSDNGDGTFTNPLIPADYPDMEVIRVEDTYYFVSTTMFIFPGVTLLKSKDLINWEYCSNAVPRFDFDKCYNLDGGFRYRHGQWATSLQYAHGKFHLLFITLDEGAFYLTADQAEGPWKIAQLPRGFYDPGLFFDDYGRTYVAHGYDKIYVTEVDSNLYAISQDVLVYEADLRSGLEGARVYKRNGYYYLYCTYGGHDGFQVALRSRNIFGPYEQKKALHDLTPGIDFGIHQGALVETQTGEWWTMLFVDSGPFGKSPTLHPVEWVDNWPIAGVDGKALTTYRKPNVGKEPSIPEDLPTSDDFDEADLGMQWGLNHNPSPEHWSLTDNPGYLRLTTGKTVSDLRMARNALTQRAFHYYSDTTRTYGTAKMDFEGMRNGDLAGLAILQDPYAFIAIKKIDGKHYNVMVQNGMEIESVQTDVTTIYLRATPMHGSGGYLYYNGDPVPGSSTASFYYSFDNLTFTEFGCEMQMKYNLDFFSGIKFSLFNYPTIEAGGYVDFYWFRMKPGE